MVITPSEATEDSVTKTSVPPPSYSQATAPPGVETAGITSYIYIYMCISNVNGVFFF